MRYGVETYDDFTAYQDERPVRDGALARLFGGVALAVIAAACSWTLYVNVFAARGDAVLVAPPVVVAVQAPVRAFHLDRVLLDPARPVGFAPKTLARSAPLSSAFQFYARAPAQAGIPLAQNDAPQQVVRAVASVPLPTPRPAELALRAMAQRNKVVPVAMASISPFEKLFGKKETGPALAYAAPDGGVANDGQSLAPGRMPPNDGLTAIYDISARTVYLPNGAKLEAHSGLRDKLDDPRYVHVKMWGATPPHTYDLAPRESLFHGVEALRLIPVGGEGEIFGRTGLLAHSFMLGPKGDSNGCVSFRNYDAFLRAYKNGVVKRLVVVARLS